MIYVTHAHYIEGYKIHVTFNDHHEGMLDLKEVITKDPRAIFKGLSDIEQFKRFKVAADTVVWENGLDLAPEFLYQKLLDKKNSNNQH